MTNQLNPNRYTSTSILNKRSLLTLAIAATLIAGITSCGELTNPPEKPESPAQTEPKKEPKPRTEPVTTEECNQMCDDERQWAYETGLIDLNQLRLFERRNFAPIFNTPGERQSGIEGWIACEKALKTNGFISNQPTARFKRAINQETLV